MSVLTKRLKKGFVDGLLSLLQIDLNPPKRKIGSNQGVGQYWVKVGSYLHGAMDDMEKSPVYRYRHSVKDDAHSIETDEQDRDFEHA